MKFLALTTEQADMLEYFIGEFMVNRELPAGWRHKTHRGYEFGGKELRSLLNSVQTCYWAKDHKEEKRMTEESKRKLARELEKVPTEETIIIEHDGQHIK